MQAQDAFNGLRLWESHVNERGGLLTPEGRRTVRLIVYDDRSSRRRVEENVRMLIHDDRVDLLFGPYSSGLAKAAAALARREKTLLWNHGGTSDHVCEAGGPFLISIPPPSSRYFESLPRLPALQQGRYRRIAILCRNQSPFARSIAGGLNRAAWEQEMEAVTIPFEDYASERERVLQALAALRPYCVTVAGRFEEEIEIVRDRDRFPSSVETIAAVAAGVTQFWEQLGELAEEIIGPTQWEAGVDFPDRQGPDSGWFVREFENRFTARPNYTAAQAFACGLIASLCLEQAPQTSAERLRAAAAELDCFTFFGRFRIDPKTGCQAGHRMLLIQWRHGRRQIVWPSAR